MNCRTAQAAAALQELIEHLGAPVFTTQRPRGNSGRPPALRWRVHGRPMGTAASRSGRLYLDAGSRSSRRAPAVLAARPLRLKYARARGRDPIRPTAEYHRKCRRCDAQTPGRITAGGRMAASRLGKTRSRIQAGKRDLLERNGPAGPPRFSLTGSWKSRARSSPGTRWPRWMLGNHAPAI